MHKHLKAAGFSGVLLAFAMAVALPAPAALAQSTSYDPYADSVAATAAAVTEANNATGAPNGTSASLVGVSAGLTLDMGAGEEGTQTLRLHLGQIGLQANLTIAFLDANKAVITSESRQLGLDLSPSTQNFAYNWTAYGKAYRFVRISSALGAGVNVDAVEATGYIGSTPSQDTDGDGVPDRTEQQKGTDPLVANPHVNPAVSIPAAPASPGRTGSRVPGVSAQVNDPPTANNDTDGDGMPNDWEIAHNLDPKDKTDATEDPDHDDLINLHEYQIGSNPQKYDTDGDGMPDGWEHVHGLDVNKNDADGDPDGDFLTNLGEYRHNTDPNKADDLAALFGKACNCGKNKKAHALLWLLIGLGVGGAGTWVFTQSRKTTKPTKKLRKK